MEINNIRKLYGQGEKTISAGDTEKYDAVIIKRDCDRKQLKSEYQMLQSLAGKFAAKVYEFDEEEGILIEEQILPGTVLRKETSLKKRLDAFGQVFQNIHMEADEGKSYLDWLVSAKNFCENNQVGECWLERAKLAYGYCEMLFEKYPDRVLLHGDLHHDNLLLRADGSYALIDPKGICGPKILDLPRFVLNEIDTDFEGSAGEHVAKVIRLLSSQLGYDETDVAKAFVMEAILANIWFLEDGMELRDEQMQAAEYVLGELL